jgi:hypothetical protein
MKNLFKSLAVLLVIIALAGCTATFNINTDTANSNEGTPSSNDSTSDNTSSEVSSSDLESFWNNVEIEIETNSNASGTSSETESTPESGSESGNENSPEIEPLDPTAPTVYLDATRSGNTITVKLMVKNNPGVAAYTVKVDYDKEKVTPKTITAGVTTPVVSNLQQPNAVLHGSVTAVYANTAGTKENGEMFNITFDIVDGATGNAEFKIVADEQDFVAPDYAYIMFQKQNTSISVS